MTDKTLIVATELAAAPATDDYFWIWDSSVSQLKRISVANAITAFITGGGVIATGGFTLTVPQAMTAAGRNVANTFSALQTFSSGIAFANETLSTYDEGTWSPAITGSGGDPTVAYTTQTGKYTQIGNVVFFAIRIVINTISGGSGQIRISLPSTVSTVGTASAIRVQGVDLTGTPANVIFLPTSGSAYGNLITSADNASETMEGISALAAGDTLQASGFYFIS